jgi:hypothetical protein
MGENQIRNLRKIRAFASNSSLRDHRQGEIRTQCLRYWEVSFFSSSRLIQTKIIHDFQLPDEPRQKPKRLVCNDVQQNLFYQVNNSFLNMIFFHWMF